MTFEILISEQLDTLNPTHGLSPTSKKYVLSMINDFEDGKWRFDEFQKYIWNNIAETALSYKERNALVDSKMSSLVQAAKNLRIAENDKIGEGSEIAEIVLYGVMKSHYNALPVVPKIFYKQNPKDNAKGADGVHIVLEGKNDFSIWFGESKFYNSIENRRLDKIIESVGESLTTEKLKKENSIVTSVGDLKELVTDPTTLKSIEDMLSPRDSIDNLKSKLHIPIMLVHECEITQEQDQISDKYKNELKDYYRERATKFYEKMIAKNGAIFKYDEITFHLIIIPVFKKKPVVDKFVETAKSLKDL